MASTTFATERRPFLLRRTDRPVRFAALCFVLVHAWRLGIVPVGSGLDGSCIFMINEAFRSGRLDFIFTYGPLGFLVFPLAVGSNLEIALVAHLVAWTVLALTAGSVVMAPSTRLRNVVLFAFLFGCGEVLKFDYLLLFLILFLLALALYIERPPVAFACFATAALVSVLLGFVKLSTAIVGTATVVTWVVLAWLGRRRGVRGYMAVVGLGAALYVALESAFAGSLSAAGFIARARARMAIVVGYNEAMSVDGPTDALLLAVLCLLAFGVLVRLLARFDPKALLLGAMLVPGVVLAFKHGYVRQDVGHVPLFFAFMLWMLGLLVLFADWGKTSKWSVAVVLMAPTVLPLFVARFSLHPLQPVNDSAYTSARRAAYHLSGLESLRGLRAAADLGRTKGSIERLAAEHLRAFRLPDAWLSLIGDGTVGVFPWEVAYVKANRLTYRQFPVIQSYAAYAPLLDQLNARYLEDSSSAPAWVLMEWASLDGRHPLMDVPAMWLALFKWYDVKERAVSEGLLAGGDGRGATARPVLLLGRRRTPRFTRLEFFQERQVTLGDTLEAPPAPGPLVANVRVRRTWRGILTALLFRIPPLTVNVAGDAGAETYRVIPENLGDGLLLGILPQALHDAARALAGDLGQMEVRSIQFGAHWARYYHDDVRVQFFTISDLDR